ncbi:hypothetical protein [Streptomyces sp. NPDC017958]
MAHGQAQPPTATALRSGDATPYLGFTQPDVLVSAVRSRQVETGMRDFSSKANRLGSAMVVASLAVVVPAAATGTAHGNPNSTRVTVAGTASCERFEDSSATDVTIAAKGKTASDQLSGENVSESYSVTFTKVPQKGLQANVKVTCVDSDNDQHTFGKSITIARPASPGTETQTVNLK